MEPGDPVQLQCYNRGCGKKYNQADNGPESCLYHSGEPFFHDAYKGWSCCKKKSIDFTTFLSIPPCTRGYHSNVKPDNTNKLKEVTKDSSHELITQKPIKIINTKHIEVNESRPSLDEVMITIQTSVFEQYQKYLDNSTLSPNCSDNSVSSRSVVCTNTGCGATRECKEDICVFHPGQAIFHEGMKYWSCCKKKTTDFNNFINQIGCERGEHNWESRQSSDKTQESLDCRLDMYQMSKDCVVSIFAKNIQPQSCLVSCNRVRLRVSFKCQQGNYEKSFDLFGVINPVECKATISQSKLEISLRKSVDTLSLWPRLTLF
ncbi:hypothetical protein GJ496_000423 [Pomphorhynchus laevis]|nr:hypothetical protein GJ496_000423 [Pomphorhynchus laevis]